MGRVGALYEMERQRLLSRFIHCREMTEKLCLPLKLEDYVISSSSETNSPKWHLAHTTWFFENFILMKHKNGYEPFKAEYNFIFNSFHRISGVYPFVDEKKYGLSRPTVDEILEYRSVITNALYEFVNSISEEKFQQLDKTFELAINYEERHQELILMDIKRNFFENPLRPKYSSINVVMPSYLGSDHRWVNLPSALVRIGVEKKHKDFSFDNERDAHSQWIESCMISSHLVTNDEYLAFMEAGGYDNHSLWPEDGWKIKEKEGWSHPLYWEQEGQTWWTMTLSGMLPINHAAPVSHISYYEAKAFAHWKGCRLPTEFEWEVASAQESRFSPFLEDEHLDAFPADEDHENFSQIHGTLWEWTQSAYLPYPRYEKFQHALTGYDDKYMCNQFVLRGGSCITPRQHYRSTYRNFHYPHMRWQYAGIRLAKDLA
jgi:ergothioneine biosynthesis protein EgtB